MSRTRKAIERTISGDATRPLCLIGPSGSGKTRQLREALRAVALEGLWTTARDTADAVVEALSAGRYDSWREAFAGDPRPLVIEHVEDLRGRHRTLEELRCLLDLRRARGHASLLTLTLEPRSEDVVNWLVECCEPVWTGTVAGAARGR
jgi:hypothetical protein